MHWLIFPLTVLALIVNALEPDRGALTLEGKSRALNVCSWLLVLWTLWVLSELLRYASGGETLVGDDTPLWVLTCAFLNLLLAWEAGERHAQQWLLHAVCFGLSLGAAGYQAIGVLIERRNQGAL